MDDLSAFTGWRSDEYGNLYAPNDTGETIISDADIGGLQPEYAARIVACVNACADISTADLLQHVTWRAAVANMARPGDITNLVMRNERNAQVLEAIDQQAACGLHATPSLVHGWLRNIRATIKAARS